MQKHDSNQKLQKKWMWVGIVFNLVVLLIFKVITVYLQELIEFTPTIGLEIPGGLSLLTLQAQHLPLGLSFFTFQSITMFVDLRKQKSEMLICPSEMFTYLFMFPKVIAGPITGMREMISQLQAPQISYENAAKGLRRFMVGFGKKTLIADQLALVTQSGIFGLDPLQIPTGTAWLALLCFAFQIYFDFSAYTDMAIGIGQALGFTLPENFDYPYAARSMTEFWRRWHMTLTGWFRKHVFFPLERKRRKVKWMAQSFNILIVFIMTGLWHGISLPFIVWGLWHGAALALERGKFGRWLERRPRPFQHFYTLSIILAGWVLFLSPSLRFAQRFLFTLFGFSRQTGKLPFSTLPPFSNFVWAALAAAVIFSVPWRNIFKNLFPHRQSVPDSVVISWVKNTLVLLLFIIGIIFQAGTDFLPFIYGEF